MRNPAGSDGDDELICYCFHHSRGDIREDVHRHGHSTILTAVLLAHREGRCRCETLHPQGR
ncbi:hypothetical protein [Desulfuromonas sp. AOP6]|uniref:hypothetical protein n=1 Tax=Desulfuromonas sp. AOP6 TaxID=1566351 RepID=UPI00127FA3F8|nr:hypothetical protein [Desulfuromonas sp. AOP6]BCA80816.1 hypothetical protein AOP6_2603 [Desulfuromonas sp. AOP6]